MTVREATVDDLDAIMRLERASFGATAWSATSMRGDLTSPHTHYVVLTDPEVRGYAGLRIVRGSRDADIQTIAIAEAARGRGYGRTLLTTLLERAAELGAREVFLDVRDDNATAHALYASEGFVDIGRRPGYYAAEGVDALVMRLDLRSWRASRRPDAADAGACT